LPEDNTSSLLFIRYVNISRIVPEPAQRLKFEPDPREIGYAFHRASAKIGQISADFKKCRFEVSAYLQGLHVLKKGYTNILFISVDKDTPVMILIG